MANKVLKKPSGQVALVDREWVVNGDLLSKMARAKKSDFEVVDTNWTVDDTGRLIEWVEKSAE